MRILEEEKHISEEIKVVIISFMTTSFLCLYLEDISLCKLVRKCVAPGSKSGYNGENVSVYRFKPEWTKHVPRKDWTPNSNSVWTSFSANTIIQLNDAMIQICEGKRF